MKPNEYPSAIGTLAFVSIQIYLSNWKVGIKWCKPYEMTELFYSHSGAKKKTFPVSVTFCHLTHVILFTLTLTLTKKQDDNERKSSLVCRRNSCFLHFPPFFVFFFLRSACFFIFYIIRARSSRRQYTRGEKVWCSFSCKPSLSARASQPRPRKQKWLSRGPSSVSTSRHPQASYSSFKTTPHPSSVFCLSLWNEEKQAQELLRRYHKLLQNELRLWFVVL